ncbi:MAG: hypothetical protein ABSC11_15535 [Smithella sp.]|jgi:hypothetical protein
MEHKLEAFEESSTADGVTAVCVCGWKSEPEADQKTAKAAFARHAAAPVRWLAWSFSVRTMSLRLVDEPERNHVLYEVSPEALYGYDGKINADFAERIKHNIRLRCGLSTIPPLPGEEGGGSSCAHRTGS